MNALGCGVLCWRSWKCRTCLIVNVDVVVDEIGA